MAEKVIPFRHPKLSAIKIAQREGDDITGKSLDQLKAEIADNLKRLQAAGAFALVVDVEEPVGDCKVAPKAGAKRPEMLKNGPAR